MSISQEIPAQLLTGALRSLQAAEDLNTNGEFLNEYFPSENVDGIEYTVNTGTTRTYTPAAPYRAFDTSAPIGDRPGRGWAKGKIPPLSMSYILGEEDQIRLREMAAARAAGAEIDFNEILTGDVFDDLGNGLRAIYNRAALGQAELLRTGKIVIGENGVQLTYDAERDAGRASTAATLFSNVAAPAFAMERAVLNTMRAEERLPWTAFDVLSNQNTWDEYTALTEVKEAYQSNRVLPRITDSQAVQVRSEQSLPPVRIIDTMVEDTAGVLDYLIPDGLWLYVPKPTVAQVGRTQFGVPLAASKPELNLVASNRAGPVAYMYDRENPITLTLVVDAIMLPTMHDPDGTFAWTVS